MSTELSPISLLQNAMDKDVSVDTLQGLMDLYDRHLKTKSLGAFNKAMTIFHSELKSIPRKNRVYYTNQKGQTTDFKFAGLTDIMNVIKPALVKAGLTVRWSNKDNNGKLSVTCHITHIEGHSEQCTIEAEADTSGGKNGIQAKGSTLTYLQRYTLSLALAIVTEDDLDGQSTEGPTKPEPTPEQFTKMREAVVDKKVTIESIQKRFTLTEEQLNILLLL